MLAICFLIYGLASKLSEAVLSLLQRTAKKRLFMRYVAFCYFIILFFCHYLASKLSEAVLSAASAHCEEKDIY